MEEARRKVVTEEYLAEAAAAWANVSAGDVEIPLSHVYVMLQALEEPPQTPPGGRPDLVPTPERLSNTARGGMMGFRQPEGPVESRISPFSPPIPLFKALSESDHLVLLGEPGAGKSTTLQFIGLRFARGEGGSCLHIEVDYIPVWISLGTNADLLVKPGAYLEKAISLAVVKILRGSLEETKALKLVLGWLQNGRLLVLLDGLDEVPSDKRPEVRQEILAFTRVAGRQGCRVIVSSRRVGYTRLGSPFKEFTIKPLEKDKEAGPYIESWLQALRPEWQDGQAAEKAGQLLEEMGEQPGLKKVLDNPLILRLSAEIFARDGSVAKNRSDLYACYIDSSWELALKRGANEDQKAQALEALENLAWDLQMGTAIKSLDSEALLREKMGLVARSGQSFIFSHTTFQGYFVAQRLLLNWTTDREVTWNFQKPRLHLSAWREPLLLFFGSLESGEATEFVQRVLNAGSSYERFLHRDLALAASLVGETGLIESTVGKRLRRRIKRLVSPVPRILIAVVWFVVFVLVFLGIAAPFYTQGVSPWLISIGGLLWIVVYLASLIFSPISIAVFDPGEDWKKAIQMLEELGASRPDPILIAGLKRGDNSVSETAAKALKKLGAQEAIPILIDALKDKDNAVRMTAAEALGDLGAEKTIPDLVAVIEEQSSIAMTKVAAKSLGKMGVAAIPALLSAAEKVDEIERLYIAEALGTIGVAAIPHLVTAIKDSSVAGSVAGEALGAIGAAAIPALLEVLVEKKDEIVKKAFDFGYFQRGALHNVRNAFYRIRTSDEIPALMAALTDEDWELRIWAAVELKVRGVVKTELAPGSTFQDEYTNILEEATNELTALGTVKVIPRLLNELKDADFERYSAAVEELVRIGPEGIPHLKEALKDIHQDVRRGAARALGELKATDAIPDLGVAIQDISYEVREEATRALGKIGDAQAIPYLNSVLNDEMLSVSMEAAWALGEIGDPRAVPYLHRALSNEDNVRRIAVAALGKIGPEVIPTLENLLSDENNSVSGEAARALGKLINAQEMKLAGKEHTKQIRFLQRIALKLQWITRGRNEALTALSIVAERLDFLNLNPESPSKLIRSVKKGAVAFVKILLLVGIAIVLGFLGVISGIFEDILKIRLVSQWEMWVTSISTRDLILFGLVCFGVIGLFKLFYDWLKKQLMP